MALQNLPYLDISADAEELAARAESWLFAEIERTHAGSMFIPAGRTPLPLYERWERTRPPVLRDLMLCPVDEVVTGPGAGMFSRFLAQALPSYTPAIAPVAAALEKIPPVALLGLGLNGHVAFHEPHVDPGFSKGSVELETSTCRELGFEPPVQGLSYGVGTFRQCQSVAIIVSNERKRPILRRLLEGESMPARWLLDAFVSNPAREAHFRIFTEASLVRSV